MCRKRAFDKKNAEIMDKIQLGVDCPYSPKQWQISAPTTHTAMTLHLYCKLYEKQWQLPPLTTKKNKRLWNPAEIVIREIKRECVLVIFQLF